MPILGGDDFFVGLKNYDDKTVLKLACKIQDEFKNSVKNIYSNEDKDNGFVVLKDRFDVTRKFKLLSVSCAIIKIDMKSDISNFDNTLNILKKESKGSLEPVFRVL